MKVIEEKQATYKTTNAVKLGKLIKNWSNKLWGIKPFPKVIEQLKTLQQQKGTPISFCYIIFVLLFMFFIIKGTQFYVQIIDGKRIAAYVNDQETVYDLKCQIQAFHGTLSSLFFTLY